MDKYEQYLNDVDTMNLIVNFIFGDFDAEKDKEKLFMFKPMSDSSIITSYDLSISVPKGDFQSMLAIQTMPAGRSLFPLDSIIDKYLGINMIN